MRPRVDSTSLSLNCKAVSGPWVENALDPENAIKTIGNQQGILCLQNIEALSLKAQGHLLRLLDNQNNSSESLSVVALTRSDLKKAVKETHFLLELYEYLSRFHIHMPPLRERTGDMPLLTKKLLKEISSTYQTKMTQVETEVIEACNSYNWPGNIRQLEGMLSQVALNSPQEATLRVEHMPDYLRGAAPPKVVMVAADMKLPRQGVVLEDLEKNLLKQALEQMMGNQSRAARLLGISRFALRYRMEKYGLFPKTKEQIMAAAMNEWSE